MIKKKILMTSAIVGTMFAPIVTTISCGSKNKATNNNDLFVFTGKNENVAQLELAAKKFEALYQQFTGKKIKIKVQGAGNGVDVNTLLAGTLQKRSNTPDVITSFGMGDIQRYIENKIVSKIDPNDNDLKWTSDISKWITTEGTTRKLITGMKDATSGDVYGIPINFEAVGVVVNLKTLGAFIKTNAAKTDTTFNKIGGKNISEILTEAGITNISTTNKTNNEIGQVILKHIYKVGWTWDDLEKLISEFKASNKRAFAMTGVTTEGWIPGFHAVPNWFSTRGGSATSNNVAPWAGYVNHMETAKPWANKAKTEKEDILKGVTKTPYEYLELKSDIQSDEATTNNKNYNKQTKAQIEQVVEEFYKILFGPEIIEASEVGSKKPADLFKYFADGSSLFTHASTGMYPWIIKATGGANSQISLTDIVPIPLPLKTKNINVNEYDKYKDVPVDVGMMWHLVSKNKDANRQKLAKKFLEWLSTGKTSVSVIKNGKTETVNINDDYGVKQFYNSNESKLVNPFKVSLDAGNSGDDITSRIISKEIEGKDWGDSNSVASDHVTFWTNGYLGRWGGDVLGAKALTKAGKSDYKLELNQNDWNEFKERAKNTT